MATFFDRSVTRPSDLVRCCMGTFALDKSESSFAIADPFHAMFLFRAIALAVANIYSLKIASYRVMITRCLLLDKVL